ncbi:MAG: hypothetical protein ABJZ79_18780 [Parasphingorhabdus sp.]|uniref:MotE family protein n=1 Tax=Parasphingorhabdus sp. TaxID=2709688 RepID=UPI00329A44EF
MSKAIKQARPRRLRGGVLMLISMLLTGSALLRFGVEAAPAIGREVAQSDHPVEERSVPEFKAAERTQAPVELQHVLAALQDREERLKQRELALEERLEALSIADAAIDRKLVALVEAEETLQRTLAMADGAAEGDLTQLTGVYEKMKPKDAAALFEEMAPSFAAGFLARMNPESAAAILAGLSPRAAYTISVVLAGRNANVPTE